MSYCHQTHNNNTNTNNNNNRISSYNHALQDYMFTHKNLTRFLKYSEQQPNDNNNNNKKEKQKKPIIEYKKREIDNYKPSQKDSLFWCFYILKHGYSNYEMEISNQYFIIEKQEKFKYIELLRQNKEILKIHKIKPFTELEDDLANKERISIKTFFALCIIEKINVLLVDKRKIYEIITSDSETTNIIHRNNTTYEHYIEFDKNNEKLQKYKNTYYVMQNFDSSFKAISYYKVEELLEICAKLDINIHENNDNDNNNKKKKTKKDIYELIVQNF